MSKNEKYFLNSLRYASFHAALSSFLSSERITAGMRFAPRLGAYPNYSLRPQLLISANNPLQKLLPEGITPLIRNGESINLAHLANHTSGLLRTPDNFTRTNPKNSAGIEVLKTPGVEIESSIKYDVNFSKKKSFFNNINYINNVNIKIILHR